MKRKAKKSLSIIITFAMLLVLLPMTASFSAEESNIYLTYNKVYGVFDERTIPKNALMISTLSNLGKSGQITWYYVDTDDRLDFNGDIAINGDVHLILMNGSKLNLNGRIALANNNSMLTIYAQSNDESEMGELYVQTDLHGAAGIGSSDETECGQIMINGGKITAYGGFLGAGIGGGDINRGGCVIINGGIVEAHGGKYASGIGTGNKSNSGFPIKINGGKVTSYGGEEGAGIGAANLSENVTVTINGGEIYAHGGKYGAGIGSGDDAVSTVTINSGDIHAYGGDNAAGIGSGNSSDKKSKCTVTVNNGTIHANGGVKSPGIGSGYDGSDASVTINDGILYITGGQNAPGIGSSWKDSGSASSCNIWINGAYIASNGANGAPAIGANGGNFRLNIKEGLPCYYEIYEGESNIFSERVNYPGDGSYIMIRPLSEPEHTRVRSLYVAPDIQICECICGNYFEGDECSDENLIGDMIDVQNYFKEHGFDDYYLKYDYYRGKTVLETMPQKAEVIDDECSEVGTDGQETWYLFEGTMERGELTVHGNVNIILKDGADIKVNNGIHVNNNAKLTLYSQSEGENQGKLSVTSKWGGAAIGSMGNESYSEKIGVGGTVVINGGNITASGNKAGAAIGGGHKTTNNVVEINGGVISAVNDDAEYNFTPAIGITCGDINITINGGKITGKVNSRNAVIGSGDIYDGMKSTCRVTINGGILDLAGDIAIGSGSQAYDSTVDVHINGCDITAKSSNAAFCASEGIFKLSEISACNFDIYENGGTMNTLKKYTNEQNVRIVKRDSHRFETGFSGASAKYDDDGNLVAFGTYPYYRCMCGLYYEDKELTKPIGDESALSQWLSFEGRCDDAILFGKYYDYDSEKNEYTPKTVPENTLVFDSVNATTIGTEGEESWYIILRKDIEFYNQLKVKGDVHLILADGINAKFKNGIMVCNNHSLTIYAQSLEEDVMGRINATVTNTVVSGMEGGTQQNGRFTVNGGYIKASGKPAIGSASSSKGKFFIIINGGFINANSGSSNGSAIGAHLSGGSVDITINAGDVYAYCNNPEPNAYCSATIGSGNNRNATVTINGGNVTAVGGQPNAAIGSGTYGNATVTINGGNITASAGVNAAAIGSSYGGKASVTINGGNITASAGENTAAIGSCRNGNATVIINGGNIEAKGLCTGIGTYIDKTKGKCNIQINDADKITAIGDQSAVFGNFEKLGDSIGIFGGSDETSFAPITKDMADNYQFVRIGTKNAIKLTVNEDKTFAADLSGENRGMGIVTVALYDGAELNRLLDIKVFELAKGQNPTGEFTKSGYVRAYWWSNLDDITPLCEAKGKDLKITTP